MMKKLFLVLLLCATGGIRAGAKYEAVVDARYSEAPGRVVKGVPHFASLSQALAVAPATSAPWRIFIRKGRYYEKVTINRPEVHLIGENREATLLTFDAHSDTPGPSGGTLGTWGCATLMIRAPGFTAVDLTIENGFDYPGNARKPPGDSTKVRNTQAVAVMLAEGSDRAFFGRCTISGYQDTLFPNAGRSCFDRCRILGHVDFIFGAGQALFEGCEIVSRDRPDKNPTGYITAPSTPASFPYGFLFLDCRLIKEHPDLARGSVRLGRPWHPHADPAVSGSAIFINCFIEDHLGPEGYAEISAVDSTGEKILFTVEPDSRFFEYGSRGPGALITRQRPQLSAEAAAWYSRAQILRGWSP